MANKLKTYTALILVLIGLMFLRIGCAGKNNESSSPSQNISSDGAPAKEATAQ